MDVLNFAQFIDLEGENDKMIVIVKIEKKTKQHLARNDEAGADK